MTSQLWWVSVGGNACEPARVVTDAEGVRTVFTIGCETGTLLSEGGIALVERIGDVPDTPAEAERKRIVWEKQQRGRSYLHGYRRFD